MVTEILLQFVLGYWDFVYEPLHYDNEHMRTIIDKNPLFNCEDLVIKDLHGYILYSCVCLCNCLYVVTEIKFNSKKK